MSRYNVDENFPEIEVQDKYIHTVCAVGGTAIAALANALGNNSMLGTAVGIGTVCAISLSQLKSLPAYKKDHAYKYNGLETGVAITAMCVMASVFNVKMCFEPGWVIGTINLANGIAADFLFNLYRATIFQNYYKTNSQILLEPTLPPSSESPE